MNRRSFLAGVAAPLIIPSSSLTMTETKLRKPTAYKLFYLFENGWGQGHLMKEMPDPLKIFPYFDHKIEPHYGALPPVIMAA